MGRLHAPNEFLRIRRLRERMRAWEELWRLLADGPAPAREPGGRRWLRRFSSSGSIETMVRTLNDYGLATRRSPASNATSSKCPILAAAGEIRRMCDSGQFGELRGTVGKHTATFRATHNNHSRSPQPARACPLADALVQCLHARFHGVGMVLGREPGPRGRSRVRVQSHAIVLVQWQMFSAEDL